jgi:hypothetical protein
MYYAMQLVEGFATRVGPMTPKMTVAIAFAKRAPNGYVEQYGRGVIWTRKQAAGDLWRSAPRVGVIRER